MRKKLCKKKNAPDNNLYINCFEEIKGYYLDESDWKYKPCYESCKVCKTNGNANQHNCVECKENYGYEIKLSNSDYKNCLIPNKTNNISNIIENIINDTNIIDINNGKDSKFNSKNKQIVLTTTINQKNNEEENNITMDLGQCENILKKRYNISNNNSLYILQIISE